MVFFLRPSENLIPNKGDGDGHQRGDDVEETVGKVLQRGDLQHHRLRHAAGVPRHQHGGDGGGILGGTAQQASFIPFVFVQLLEDVAGQHDAEVLVAGGHVGKEARAHRGGNQRAAAADATGQCRRDTPHHAASCQCTAEGGGTEDEEHRAQHSLHAAGLHQAGKHVVACVDGGAAVVGDHQRTEAVALADLRHNVGLHQQHDDACYQGRQKQDDGRRQPQRDEYCREERHQQQPRTDDEAVLQSFGKRGRLRGALAGVGQARHKEDGQGDDERGDGGDEHVADVREQWHLAHRRGQHGGVGERGDLVAEVGARNDGAGGPAHREAVRRADADEGDADGGHSGPRAARDERHQCADQAGHEEEHRRRDDFHAVVDHGGHDAAHHPAARDGADEEQDEYGGTDGLDVVADGLVDGGPLHLVADHGDGHGHGGGEEQGGLAGAVDGVGAELPDDEHLQCHEHGKRHKCDGPVYAGRVGVHISGLFVFDFG